ncbi:hypothetical protein ABW636_18055 [Aquimarina sp. 2201CG1-2-11]|uniref:hypothetical protein n=1 Tax=Aquimarina discodermiae TaxID=3231043 RepID=UPI003461BCBB
MLEQISKLGKTLNRSELRTVSGGTYMPYRPGNSIDQDKCHQGECPDRDKDRKNGDA